jgi:hypothetical protein
MNYNTLITPSEIIFTTGVKELTLEDTYISIRCSINTNLVTLSAAHKSEELFTEYTFSGINIAELFDDGELDDIKIPPGIPGSASNQLNMYLHLGVGMTLSLFGLHREGAKILEPLEVILPDISLEINILNKKYYHYFRTYGKYLHTLGSNPMLERCLEFLNTFWDQVGDHMVQTEDSAYQDMLCIHAANVGYSLFLEARIKEFIEGINTRQIVLDNQVQKKNVEVEGYYNSEILKIAEKTSALKGEHSELIKETKDTIKKVKQDTADFIAKHKKDTLVESKREIQKVITAETGTVSENFGQIVNKRINDLESSINSLENKQLQKIKGYLDEITVRRTSTLADISKFKQDFIKELAEIATESKEESLKTKNSLLKDLEEIKRKIDNHREGITQINSELDIKVNLITALQEKNLEVLWEEIRPLLKPKITEIIQEVLDETLKTLGENIDRLINTRIDKHLTKIKN